MATKKSTFDGHGIKDEAKLDEFLPAEIISAIEAIQFVGAELLMQNSDSVVINVVVKNDEAKKLNLKQNLVAIGSVVVSLLVGVTIGIEMSTTNPQLAHVTKILLSLLTGDF